MKVRNDWTLAQVQELFALPFMDLVFMAQTTHRRFQRPNSVQVSTLLSIKTGACPEDCAYCPQSVRFDTGLETQELKSLGMETCATLGMLTPASITTITISIPHRGITGKSSARALTRIDSTLCKPYAMLG